MSTATKKTLNQEIVKRNRRIRDLENALFSILDCIEAHECSDGVPFYTCTGFIHESVTAAESVLHN